MSFLSSATAADVQEAFDAAYGDYPLVSYGSASLKQVQETLDLEPAGDESVVTLGGFVMARLGHVPSVGEGFEWDGRRVEVVRMAGRRIELVRISAPHHRGDTSPPPSSAGNTP